MAIAVKVDDPWDHNAECKYCDEQAAHAADCSWLLGLIAQVESLTATLEATVQQHAEALHAKETVILNQVRSIGALRASLDDTLAQVSRRDQELGKANDKVEEFRSAAEDLVAKIQLIVNWADEAGHLPEHLFTFPDGDVWEPQPKP